MFNGELAVRWYAPRQSWLTLPHRLGKEATFRTCSSCPGSPSLGRFLVSRAVVDVGQRIDWRTPFAMIGADRRRFPVLAQAPPSSAKTCRSLTGSTLRSPSWSSRSTWTRLLCFCHTQTRALCTPASATATATLQCPLSSCHRLGYVRHGAVASSGADARALLAPAGNMHVKLCGQDRDAVAGVRLSGLQRPHLPVTHGGRMLP